jgi:hypothetical protein
MLTKLLIDNTKPDTKPRRLADGRGMYLEVAPTGGKWWRFKYRFDGKERRISLGVYPDVGLAEARDRREQARKHVAAGIDPGEQRRAEKIARVERTENTFAAVAREWFGVFSPKCVRTRAAAESVSGAQSFLAATREKRRRGRLGLRNLTHRLLLVHSNEIDDDLSHVAAAFKMGIGSRDFRHGEDAVNDWMDFRLLHRQQHRLEMAAAPHHEEINRQGARQ